MACTEPCFDCPCLRGSDKLKIADTVIFDFVVNHFTEDGDDGPFQPIICPEQGDICFGQIQMIANGPKAGLDPFSEIGEAVEDLPRNIKDYLQGVWEYISWHEE